MNHCKLSLMKTNILRFSLSLCFLLTTVVLVNSQNTRGRFEKAKILFDGRDTPSELTVNIRDGKVFVGEDIVLFSEEEYIPYEPDFFVNPSAIIEDYTPEQPSEQPLEQSEPSAIISKPTQKTKEELKESIRQLAERKRNEKLDDLYNESNSKTY